MSLRETIFQIFLESMGKDPQMDMIVKDVSTVMWDDHAATASKTGEDGPYTCTCT